MRTIEPAAGRWEWLHDGVFPAGSALLDSLWAFAWLDFKVASDASLAGRGFGYGWLLLALLVPALAGRLAERGLAAAGSRARRLVLVAIAVLTFLPILKAQALPGVPWGEPARWLADVVLPWTALAADSSPMLGLGWLAVGVLVIRGIWLAVNEVTPESAARWFLVGLAAFLVLFVAEAAASSGLALAASPGWLLAAFLAGSLVWLAFVRHVYLEQETFRRTVRRVDLPWLASFMVVGLLLLGVAAFVALAVGGLLRGLEQGVLLLLQLLATGLLYLSVGVFYVLYAIASWLPVSMPLLHLQELLQQLLGLAQTQLPASSGRALALPSIPPQLLAALALLAALVLVTGLGRLRSRRELDDVPGERREIVWSWRAWWRGLLAGLRSRFRRRSLVAEAVSAQAPVHAPNSVRALYRAALRWSRQRGRPRLLSETPAEFEPALRERLPAGLGEHLTAAYTRTRYGERPLPETEVARLAAEWQEAQSNPLPRE